VGSELNATLISGRAEVQLLTYLLTSLQQASSDRSSRNTPHPRAQRLLPRFVLASPPEMAAPPFEINLAEVSTLDERQEFVSMVGVQAMVRATCLQVI